MFFLTGPPLNLLVDIHHLGAWDEHAASEDGLLGERGCREQSVHLQAIDDHYDDHDVIIMMIMV